MASGQVARRRSVLEDPRATNRSRQPIEIRYGEEREFEFLTQAPAAATSEPQHPTPTVADVAADWDAYDWKQAHDREYWEWVENLDFPEFTGLANQTERAYEERDEQEAEAAEWAAGWAAKYAEDEPELDWDGEYEQYLRSTEPDDPEPDFWAQLHHHDDPGLNDSRLVAGQQQRIDEKCRAELRHQRNRVIVHGWLRQRQDHATGSRLYYDGDDWNPAPARPQRHRVIVIQTVSDRSLKRRTPAEQGSKLWCSTSTPRTRPARPDTSALQTYLDYMREVDSDPELFAREFEAPSPYGYISPGTWPPIVGSIAEVDTACSLYYVR